MRSQSLMARGSGKTIRISSLRRDLISLSVGDDSLRQHHQHPSSCRHVYPPGGERFYTQEQELLAPRFPVQGLWALRASVKR